MFPPLWEHQKKTIELAQSLDHFGLLHDAGTGKTRTLIEIFRKKCSDQSRLLKTLVLCPQVVMHNWREEIKKYSKINPDDIVLLKGTRHERYDLIMESVTKDKTPKILVANYETLLMENVLEAFYWYGLECIVADESHRIKSFDSKRTKTLLQLSKGVKYKYILTGTPVLQSPMDLFTQFQFLDGGETFSPVGTNFYAFKNHYFFNKNASAPSHVTWPDWVVRPGAEEDISKRISSIATHVVKSQCMDLPPLLKKTIPVEMSREQKKHYDSMKSAFITFLGDRACTAQLAITKALRLQQIVSGFISMEDGSVVQLKDNPRAKALSDLLDDLVVEGKKKVIVWACWRENYKQIKEVLDNLKIKYVEAHGEVPTKTRQDAIDSFCTKEDIKVFLGNQGAAGIGINLVQASYAIYYSRNFSLEHDIQSEARNYRGGSEMHSSVTRIDLVAQGTIDESIMQALANKQEVSDKLLREVSL